MVSSSPRTSSWRMPSAGMLKNSSAVINCETVAIFDLRRTLYLIKEHLLPVFSVDLPLILRLSFYHIPVHQFNGPRHDAHEAAAFHRFKALAAARNGLVAASEFHHLAAR